MRPRLRLIVLVLVLGVLVLGPVTAASAGAGQIVAGDAPAVEAPPDGGEEEEDPWTARFLAPTVLLLGVVALGGSVLYYGARVRGKYRVTR